MRTIVVPLDMMLVQLRANIEGRTISVVRRGRTWDFAIGPIGSRAVEHPPLGDLELIRERVEREGAAMPDWLAAYIAGRRDGTIKLPRGRQPRATATFANLLRHLYVLWRIERRRGAYRRLRYLPLKRLPEDQDVRNAALTRWEKRVGANIWQTDDGAWKVRSPRDLAITEVAERTGISPAHLKDLRRAALRSSLRFLLRAAADRPRFAPTTSPAPRLAQILLGYGPSLMDPSARPIFVRALSRECEHRIAHPRSAA